MNAFDKVAVIDPAHFRRVMGRFATGVAVITVTPVANRPMTRRKCAGSMTATLSKAFMPPPVLFGSTHEMEAEFAGIRQVGNAPAVEIVLGHAFLGEALELVGVTGGLCAEERIAADFLGRAAVVDLVELVTAAEFAADRIPQKLHQLHPLFRLVAVRAAHEAVDIGA